MNGMVEPVGTLCLPITMGCCRGRWEIGEVDWEGTAAASPSGGWQGTQRDVPQPAAAAQVRDASDASRPPVAPHLCLPSERWETQTNHGGPDPTEGGVPTFITAIHIMMHISSHTCAILIAIPGKAKIHL